MSYEKMVNEIINRIDAYALEICTNDYDDFDKAEAAQDALNDIMRILGVKIKED